MRTPVSPLVAGLKCRCPRCGHGRLFVLWGILTPVMAVILLRFLKATLIALQFKNKAEEGRLSDE